MTATCAECDTPILLKPSLVVGRFVVSRVDPAAPQPTHMCRACIERLTLIGVPDWMRVEVMQ